MSPPSLFTNRPLTASALSRICSASMRNRDCRASKPVVRIDRIHLRPRQRRLPIRARRDHQPDHVLHVPAVVHELDRQPIQQLLVRRHFAARAHVDQHLRQPDAEVHLPQPVHDHARRERVDRATRATSPGRAELARRSPVSSCFMKCGTCGWTTLPDLSIQLPRGRTRISRGLHRLA